MLKSKRTRKKTMNSTSRTKGERDFDFALVLTGPVEMTPEVQDALFEAGCDDATLSVRSGRAYLTFSRRGHALKGAILSAINDVRKANLGVDVLRVDDWNQVTQADIARRIGRTRQMVNQYVTGVRGPGSFPKPAYNISEGPPRWDWCEVADWLRQNNMISRDQAEETHEIALVNEMLNLQKSGFVAPELYDELMRSLWGPPDSTPGHLD
jgi:hypothetical protein